MSDRFSTALSALDFNRKDEIRPRQPRIAIDGHHIRELEQLSGLKLPADYTQFLKVQGGLTIYSVPLPTSRKTARRLGEAADQVPADIHNLSFFGLYAPDREGQLHTQDLRWQLPTCRNNLPNGLFPVGEHVQFRTLCISCREGDFGQIYLHPLEDLDVVQSSTEWVDREAALEQVAIKISPTFYYFITSIRSASEEEVDAYFELVESLLGG